MDIRGFVSGAFELDTAVRFVAVLDFQYNIVAMEQREGVPSLIPDEQTDRNMTLLIPRIMVEACQKFQTFFGEFESVSARYSKVLFTIYCVENLMIVLSFEPEVGTPFLTKIGQELKELSNRYLVT